MVSFDAAGRNGYVAFDNGRKQAVPNISVLSVLANIDPQTTDGDVSGTVTVGGQVDQGASDNKELRLDITLDDYADEVDVDYDDDGEPDEFDFTYNTVDGDLPALDMSLRDVPATGSGTTGTLEGTLAGTVVMENKP